MEMYQNEEQIIEDIIDEFDFNKVHKVMEALDWTWFIGGDASVPPEVPSISQLRKCARSLMKELIGIENGGMATGGFHVRKEIHKGKTYYSLQFVVTEWDNHYE